METRLEQAFTPAEIEDCSFRIIDSEIPEPRRYAGLLWQIARRCIHAMGDTAIVSSLELHEQALYSGLEAMRKGKEIFTDTRMLAAGLVERRMKPLGIKVVPLMELPDLEKQALERGTTRSAAAIQLVASRLNGKIIAIGNAPTALLSLLNELENFKKRKMNVKPALVIGMPVGFVNAAQSKEMLAKSEWPHFTLQGRKGGSAVAAACINAMAEMILKDQT